MTVRMSCNSQGRTECPRPKVERGKKRQRTGRTPRPAALGRKNGRSLNAASRPLFYGCGSGRSGVANFCAYLRLLRLIALILEIFFLKEGIA